MPLYQYLLEKYGSDEPILSSDISFGDYSRPWIMKQLKALCDEEKLIRFEKGVYYIPTDTLFGKSVLNPRKVIERKYILNGEDVIGYYSGVGFLNRLKITSQMSNVIEVYTNNETANVRNISVGSQRVILRKSRTEVNKENVAVLSFLEMMNDISQSFLDDEKRERIADFISSNDITKADIVAYAPVFPDKVMRNLIESEVIFHVAQ